MADWARGEPGERGRWPCGGPAGRGRLLGAPEAACWEGRCRPRSGVGPGTPFPLGALFAPAQWGVAELPRPVGIRDPEWPVGRAPSSLWCGHRGDSGGAPAAGSRGASGSRRLVPRSRRALSAFGGAPRPCPRDGRPPPSVVGSVAEWLPPFTGHFGLQGSPQGPPAGLAAACAAQHRPQALGGRCPRRGRSLARTVSGRARGAGPVGLYTGGCLPARPGRVGRTGAHMTGAHAAPPPLRSPGTRPWVRAGPAQPTQAAPAPEVRPGQMGL